jgi:hypothetical protein
MELSIWKTLSWPIGFVLQRCQSDGARVFPRSVVTDLANIETPSITNRVAGNGAKQMQAIRIPLGKLAGISIPAIAWPCARGRPDESVAEEITASPNS